MKPVLVCDSCKHTYDVDDFIEMEEHPGVPLGTADEAEPVTQGGNDALGGSEVNKTISESRDATISYKAGSQKRYMQVLG